MRGRLVLTNTVPIAAYRGAGRPVASYALERLVDEAARELGLDPAEFRRRNMIPKAKMPYKIAGGFEYDCGDFAGGDGQGARTLSDWKGFEERREEVREAQGKLRGRGIATYIEMTAPGGFAPHDQVAAQLGSRRQRSRSRTASHNHGQGHETTFAQIVSRVLGIPLERIRLRTAEAGVLHRRQPDRRLALAARPGQRDACWAAQEMVKNGMSLAAEQLESAAAGHRVRRRALPDQGHRPQGSHRRAGEEVPGQARPRLHGPAQVRRDLPERLPHRRSGDRPGDRRVRDRVLRRLRRRRQHHQPPDRRRPDAGRRHAGRGAHLRRAGVYDAAGQLLTGSFMDYAMPRAGLVGGLERDRPSGADRAPTRSAPRAWARRASPARCRR